MEKPQFGFDRNINSAISSSITAIQLTAVIVMIYMAIPTFLITEVMIRKLILNRKEVDTKGSCL